MNRKIRIWSVRWIDSPKRPVSGYPCILLALADGGLDTIGIHVIEMSFIVH